MLSLKIWTEWAKPVGASNSPVHPSNNNSSLSIAELCIGLNPFFFFI